MSRILLIDDERDVRAMIAIVLRVNHFEVFEAASAAAGLKAFAESLFDVAIVDIFLGESNGFDVIAAMRERAPRLPVVRNDRARSSVAIGGIFRRATSAEAVPSEPTDRGHRGCARLGPG